MSFSKLITAATLAVAMLSATASPADTDPRATAGTEIKYLIGAVATSGCTFTRNGKHHDAEAAAAHLKMKYRRAKRHAKTAEMFIARLASKSSLSGRPYTLTCAGEPKQNTGAWLTAKLEAYRAG